MSNIAKLKKLEEMKKLMQKRNDLLKEQKKLEPGYGVATLLEGELERAELILAAKDVVNRLQDTAEKIAKMSVEDIMPLVDNMKGEFSPEQADEFDSSANEHLSSALEGVKAAREQINSHVLRLEGKLSDEDVESSDMEMDMDSEAPVDAGLGDTDLEADMGGEEEADLELGGGEEEAGDDLDLNMGSEEPLGRARKESAENKKPVLSETKKKEVNETKTVYEQDLQNAINELLEAESFDSLEAELIADRYGFELDELTEAYETSIQEEKNAELENARTPGNALREALDIEEGMATAIGRGIGKMGSAIAGALADKDDDDKGPKTPAEQQEKAEEEAEEIENATPAELRKAANDVANDPVALKKALAASANNPATPINEHMVVEDVIEIAEDDMLSHIKNRISSVQSSKSMSVKETFGHDIKLGTPRNVVKQLAEKYGDPEAWQVARTTEGSHYIVSGAIAEDVMAKDTQKQITSLEEEIASVRKKHGDVQEDYKLPQEFKLDTLRGKLQEYNTGYQHQVAKWLSLEEARSIVEMAKKWCGKKKK